VSASPVKERIPAGALEGFRFIARPPILNREQTVFGYELLFRDGIENVFRSEDADAAARSTLESTLLMGFDVLCNGQKAFINCTRELLLKDGITLLPSAQIVVEVLENVEPDDLVVAASERLKAGGCTIALDDYVARDPPESLVPLADILKVRFRTNYPGGTSGAGETVPLPALHAAGGKRGSARVRPGELWWKRCGGRSRWAQLMDKSGDVSRPAT